MMTLHYYYYFILTIVVVLKIKISEGAIFMVQSEGGKMYFILNLLTVSTFVWTKFKNK